MYLPIPTFEAKTNTKERKDHPQLIIHRRHSYTCFSIQTVLQTFVAEVSSASYQPMWMESFISTNTACQLTRHNFTPPLNPWVYAPACACVCHSASLSVSLNVCVWDEVDGSNPGHLYRQYVQWRPQKYFI